ncbi:MAG: tetratricopeptide repeat protein [bacterium]
MILKKLAELWQMSYTGSMHMKKIIILSLSCLSLWAFAKDSPPIDEYKKLADQGGEDAGFALFMQHLSSEDGKFDTEQAVRIFQTSAEKGHPFSEFMMGKAYYNGWAMKKNYAEAAKWFRMSAEKGIPPAQYWLGICLHNGLGIQKNDVDAAQWFLKSAKQGYPPAQRNLGLCYVDGLGVEKNAEEGVKWFKKTAENGLPDGMFFLAFHYAKGWGVKQNEAEAAKWYGKAAISGMPDSQYFSGRCYQEGKGVDKDDVEAYAYYSLALSKNKDAQKALSTLSKEMTKQQIAEGNKRLQALKSQTKSQPQSDSAYDFEFFHRLLYHGK